MKFEFKVTVHYMACGQNAPNCDPLKSLSKSIGASRIEPGVACTHAEVNILIG